MMASSTTGTAATTTNANNNNDDTTTECLFTDRLSWMRRTDGVQHWWPAVQCASHSQAVMEFSTRLSEGSKIQAALAVLDEQLEGTQVPALVRFVGPGRVELVAASKCVVETESDFFQNLCAFGVTLDNWKAIFDGNESLYTEFKACCKEVLTEAAQAAQKEPVKKRAIAPIAAAAAAPPAAPIAASTRTLALHDSSNHNTTTTTTTPMAATSSEPIKHDVVMDDAGNDDDFPTDNNNGDDDDAHPSPEAPPPSPDSSVVPISTIPTHCVWDVVWTELQAVGWNVRTGGMPYIYVKPGRNSVAGQSVPGVDYLTTMKDMQAYCKEHYGWLGPRHSSRQQESSEEESESSEEETEEEAPEDEESEDDTRVVQHTVITKSPMARTPNRRTKPQDPSAPRSAESDDSSVDDRDRYQWKPLWAQLQRCGWTVIQAHNRLHDWYYVRPGKDAKTGEAGIDYFLDQLEVIAYHRDADEQENHQQRKRKAVSKKSKESVKVARTSRAIVKTAPKALGNKTSRAIIVKAAKNAKATKESKKRASATTGKVTKRVKDEPWDGYYHWWKTEPVPAFRDVWPALLKLGYTESDDGYGLPESVVDKDGNPLCYDDNGNPVVFERSTGLRKLLCEYGIPNFDASLLSNEENKNLDRWTKFANVPVTPRNSVRTLVDIQSPQKADAVLTLVVVENRFATFDGKIFVPGADQLEGGRNSRKENTHYFRDTNLPGLRACVRGKWGIGYDVNLSSKPLVDTNGNTKPEPVLTTPPKRRFSSDPSKELRLRLWAAASSAQLPVFTGLPPKKELEILKLLEEEEEEDEQYLESESEPESDSDAGVEIEAPAPVATLIPYSPKKQPAPKKPKRDNRPFYLKEPLPSFKTVWAMLTTTFGFTFAGVYSHPLMTDSFPNSEGLRKHICGHGIPGYGDKKGNLDLKDREILNRWLSFAYVKSTESNSMSVLADVKLYPDQKYAAMLVTKHGFSSLDNRYFPPGADSLKGCRQKRKKGLHYVEGIEGLREFVRGRDDFYIGELESKPRASRKKSKDPKLEEAELLSLHLWAALSDAPIPKWKPKEPKENAAEQPSKEAEDTNNSKDSSVKSQLVNEDSDSDTEQSGGDDVDPVALPTEETNAQAAFEEVDAGTNDEAPTDSNEHQGPATQDPIDMQEDEDPEEPKGAPADSKDVPEATAVQSKEETQAPMRKQASKDSSIKEEVAATRDALEEGATGENAETNHLPTHEAATLGAQDENAETSPSPTNDAVAPGAQEEPETRAPEEDGLFDAEPVATEEENGDEQHEQVMLMQTQPSWDNDNSEDECEDTVDPAAGSPVSVGSLTKTTFDFIADESTESLAHSVEKLIDNGSRRITCGPNDPIQGFATQDWEGEEEHEEDSDDEVTDSLGRIDNEPRTSVFKSRSKVTDIEYPSPRARVSMAPSETGLMGFFSTEATDEKEERTSDSGESCSLL